MAAPMDLDELIAQEDEQREVAARRDARMRALWADADAAIRTDPSYAIALAEEVNAVIAFERGREERSERARQASLKAAAAREARRAAAYER